MSVRLMVLRRAVALYDRFRAKSGEKTQSDSIEFQQRPRDEIGCLFAIELFATSRAAKYNVDTLIPFSIMCAANAAARSV